MPDSEVGDDDDDEDDDYVREDPLPSFFLFFNFVLPILSPISQADCIYIYVYSRQPIDQFISVG